MSTRYRNPDWERDDDRYGRDEDERGRYYDRGPYERGTYGAREFGTGRAFDDYGYVGGAYGGGGYSRGIAGREYGRGYGGTGSGRDYGTREYGPRYGREREGLGRDFIERGYERSHRRADERDERGGYQTDYGRTSERFFGRRGEYYGRDEDRDDYGRGYGAAGSDYGRRLRRDDDDDDDDRREHRRGREGRNWLDRAANEVRSWFGGSDDEEERYRAGAGRYRGRGPRNYRRSDERIRDDVNDRLTDNDWLDASDVEVSVTAGEVTLSGTVESRYAKRLAEDLAESVSGVTNVQNNLRVNRGWETGLGSPSVNTSAVGEAGTTGLTGSADLTDASGATATTRPTTRAAGRGQS